MSQAGGPRGSDRPKTTRQRRDGPGDQRDATSRVRRGRFHGSSLGKLLDRGAGASLPGIIPEDYGPTVLAPLRAWVGTGSRSWLAVSKPRGSKALLGQSML